MACNVYTSLKRAGVSKKYLKDIAQATLLLLQEAHIDVSIHTVGEKKIRTLNRTFRGIDKATDVLSFPIDEPVHITEESDAGDIFLCPQYIQKQARRFDVPFLEEVARMLVHGILHLRGYDHVTKKQAKKMFVLQESILDQLV